MALRASTFTASGIIIAAAAASEDTDIMGLTFKGFTSVSVYDGVDNTGALVIHLATPGTMPLNYGIVCPHGVYVEVAGTGKGSVWF